MARAQGLPQLDAWLPKPQVRTHHRHTATADAEAVWASAKELRLSDTRTLGALVRWRLPGTPAASTFRDVLRRYPFTLLEEGPGYSLSGLCGRIWTLRRDYPTLQGPDDFAAWDEPGTVRVVVANWTEPLAEDTVELCDEARIAPVDRRAALRLRVMWTAIGRFAPLIGAEAVTTAVRAAEQRPVASLQQRSR